MESGKEGTKSSNILFSYLLFLSLSVSSPHRLGAYAKGEHPFQPKCVCVWGGADTVTRGTAKGNALTTLISLLLPGSEVPTSAVPPAREDAAPACGFPHKRHCD